MSSVFSILQQNTISYVLVDLFETTVLKYGSCVPSSVPNVNNPGSQVKEVVFTNQVLLVKVFSFHFSLRYYLRHYNTAV